MTFTPPTEDSVPHAFPRGSKEWRQNPLGNRLMEHFAQPLRGRNIYIVDGVATEDYPAATYHTDGTVDQTATDRVTRTFFGGHIGELVSSSERTALINAGYATAPSSLSMDGVTGSSVSTPDSTALSITGDLDLRACIAADDYTPTEAKYLFGKAASNQFSYYFRLDTGGQLRLGWSTAGTSFLTGASTATLGSVGVTDGSVCWIRVTFDVDDGASNRVTRFYYSLESSGTPPDSVTWTQLGSTVTTAGTTSIFDGTASLFLGRRPDIGAVTFAGEIYYAEVRDGIGGTRVANPDFRADGLFLIDSSVGVDASGNVWTLNGTAELV